MNKEEIKRKLEDIIENNSYETEYTTEYYADKIAKQAFNLSLDLAAKNVKMSVQPSDMEEWENVPDEITREDVDNEEDGCEDFSISVDKQSILNLKL